MAFVFNLSVFECNFFGGVDSCAKFYVLLQVIVILGLFYPCLQLVYVSLYILFSMFIAGPLTSTQMLLVMF